MNIQCVWEHNGADSLLYCVDFVGAYTRGSSREEAVRKMPSEIAAYLHWFGEPVPASYEIEITQEKASELQICDADSDVLFDSERKPLTSEEYASLKALALKSAEDFLVLYQAVPDKSTTNLPARRTFYGEIPRTADEMYLHTKNVNEYYFTEIGVVADNSGTILECRTRGFEALEQMPGFLKNPVTDGSYGEEWSLRKLMRRFVWHDRIHARAMYRMATAVFGRDQIPDVFCFHS